MRRVRGSPVAYTPPLESLRAQAHFDDVRNAKQSFWSPPGAGDVGLPAKGGPMGGRPAEVHTFASFGEVQTGSYYDPIRRTRFATFEDKLPPPDADHSDTVDDVAALNMGRLNGILNDDETRRFYRTDDVEGFRLEGNRADNDAFAEAALVRRRHTEDALHALGSAKTDQDLGMRDVRQKPGNYVGYVPNTRFAPYAPPTHRGEEVSHVTSASFGPLQDTHVRREDGRARNTAEVSTLGGGGERVGLGIGGDAMPSIETRLPALGDVTGDVPTHSTGTIFARPTVALPGEDTRATPHGADLAWDASLGFGAAPAAAQGLNTGATDRQHAAERMVDGHFAAVGGRIHGADTLSGATTMAAAAEHKMASRPTEELVRPAQTDYASTHTVMPGTDEFARPAKEESHGYVGDVLRAAADAPFFVDTMPVTGEDSSERYVRPITPAM